jgi:hypothetical protein
MIQVDHIDEGILKFLNLKELILTANYINKIDGRNLPKGLEVIYAKRWFYLLQYQWYTAWNQQGICV